MTSPSAHSPSHATTRPSRRKSLQIPLPPQDVPIPPSLLHSPYLISPESIFQRIVSAPHHPNEEDERWLRDTVPLTLHLSQEGGKGSRLSAPSAAPSQHPSHHSSAYPDHTQPPRPQSTDPPSLSHAPPSPPLIRWRRPTHLAPEAWSGQPRVRSAPPGVADREYFSNL